MGAKMTQTETRGLPVGKQQQRAVRAIGDALVGNDRTLTFPFSSEQPVGRWFGDEVLSHRKGAADFTRLNSGGPLLFGHDTSDVVGVVERAWIGDDRRGYAKVRFAKTARGDEVMGMIEDRILSNVSFAYEVSKYETA